MISSSQIWFQLGFRIQQPMNSSMIHFLSTKNNLSSATMDIRWSEHIGRLRIRTCFRSSFADQQHDRCLYLMCLAIKAYFVSFYCNKLFRESRLTFEGDWKILFLSAVSFLYHLKTLWSVLVTIWRLFSQCCHSMRRFRSFNNQSNVEKMVSYFLLNEYRSWSKRDFKDTLMYSYSEQGFIIYRRYSIIIDRNIHRFWSSSIMAKASSVCLLLALGLILHWVSVNGTCNPVCGFLIGFGCCSNDDQYCCPTTHPICCNGQSGCCRSDQQCIDKVCVPSGRTRSNDEIPPVPGKRVK